VLPATRAIFSAGAFGCGCIALCRGTVAAEKTGRFTPSPESPFRHEGALFFALA